MDTLTPEQLEIYEREMVYILDELPQPMFTEAEQKRVALMMALGQKDQINVYTIAGELN